MKSKFAGMGFFFLAGVILAGQTRVLSHISRRSGGFEPGIILANMDTTQARSFSLRPYEQSGTPAVEVSGVLAPDETRSVSLIDLFGTEEISHVVIEGDREVRLSTTYESVSGLGSPVHVHESSEQSATWRLYPGNWEVVWDGIALVNTGTEPTDVLIEQKTKSGVTIAEYSSMPTVKVFEKALLVMGDHFVSNPEQHFEVTASQPLAITAIRGSRDNAFLWENQALSGQSDLPSESFAFGDPERVMIEGYEGHIMEPFLSRDGTRLFFNNLNHPSEDTNLHSATRSDDTHFRYEGELQGANSLFLDAVATVDVANRIFFVSLRSYDQTMSSVFSGNLNGTLVSNVHEVEGLSLMQPGWVNFDVEVSKNGDSLYLVDGRFDSLGGPYESNFFLATQSGGQFTRSANNRILENINTNELEYAACVSSDELELYFTRVATPLTELSQPRIYVATRTCVNEPFNLPYIIEKITGFAEAATLSPDNKTLYYHHKLDNRFVLYKIDKL